MLASPLFSPFAACLPVDPQSSVPPIPTGIQELDERIGGGIPRAALSEIIGGPSSGRSTFVTAIFRQAMRQGEWCSLVDVQDSFDPESAAAAGLQLPYLLWVRCSGDGERAVQAADILIQGGGFGVVVLDFGDLAESARRSIPLTAWRRLRHGAEHSGAAFLVVSAGDSGASCSRVRLYLERKHEFWTNNLLRGMAIGAEIQKPYRGAAISFQAFRKV
jgi:recombination protein RecA